MSTTVYLIVSIDTECDKTSDWSVRHPLTFRAVTSAIPDTLTPLFADYGIKPTYLLSPEVLADRESVRVLRALSHCELGTHLHGEFIEPQADYNAARTNMPQLDYSPEIERQKLTNLTRLFEQVMGSSPTSFRAGRFGISAHTLSYLAELGYRVDSSVTPFWKHEFGQHINDHWGAPVQPYFPDPAAPWRIGVSPVLQVPVTIVNAFYLRFPSWFQRRLSSSGRLHRRILRRVGVTIPRTIWLRPQRSTPAELVEIADLVIRRAGNRPAVLNMMYHNVEVVPGLSPYAASEEDVQLILNSQRILFEHLQRHYQLIPVGLSDVHALYPVS